MRCIRKKIKILEKLQNRDLLWRNELKLLKNAEAVQVALLLPCLVVGATAAARVGLVSCPVWFALTVHMHAYTSQD